MTEIAIGKRMTTESDIAYFARRAAQERKRADVPADPSTVTTHRMFASAYEAWLRRERTCPCGDEDMLEERRP